MPRKVPTRRPPIGPGGPAAVAYERQATRRADKAFYQSGPWRTLRAAILAEQPLCAECLRQGRITSAGHVHHVIERKERPDLALDAANLEPLCPPCHNALRGRG